MPVESATFISELNSSYPGGSESKSEGDNHLRLLKATLQATFKNANTEMDFEGVDLVVQITGNVNKVAGDFLYFPATDYIAAAAVISLPAIAGVSVNKRRIFISQTSAAVSFSPAGTDTVNGVNASFPIPKNATIELVATAMGWLAIACGVGVAQADALSADVASASSCNIWSTAGDSLSITGAVDINDFATAPRAGARKRCIAAGAFKIKNSATIACQGSADIVAAVGDVFEVLALTTTTFSVFYSRKSGKALAPSGYHILITKTASASASLEFTTSDFDMSLYDRIEFHVNKLLVATAGRQIAYQVGIGAGPTYQTAGYYGLIIGDRIADGTARNLRMGNTAHMSLCESSAIGMSASSNGGISVTVTIVKPGAAGWKNFIHSAAVYNENNGTDAVVTVSAFAGHNDNTTAPLTAIKFFDPNGGNLASGSITAVGIKDT